MPDGYLPRFLSRDGLILPGEKRVIQVGQPAAGAEWSVTVPGGRQWFIIGGLAILTTSAVVANRRPGFQASDGTTTYLQAVGLVQVAASQFARLGYGPHLTASVQGAADAVENIVTPYGWLPPGSVLQSLTLNLSAGDQYSAVALFVEECWLDDQEITKLAMEADNQEAGTPLPWGQTFTGKV